METANFIDSFASQVEKRDRVKNAKDLEQSISSLKRRYDPTVGSDEEREGRQQVIQEKEAHLAQI